MSKKLKFNFTVNGKKAGSSSMAVNEMIHMDIERKLGDFAGKAYTKAMSDHANPNHAILEIKREIAGFYDGLQQIADMAIAQEPVKADLNIVLSGMETMGEELKCRITL